MKRAKHIFALLLSLICLLAFTIPAFAAYPAADVIDQVYVQLSASPVAMMDPGTIWATTSTPGCSLVSMAWYDVYSQPITGAFTTGLTTLVLNIAGYGGSVFAGNTAAYINGEPVPCAVGNGGVTLTLTQQFAPPVLAPTISKHPGDDVVDEGGMVSFVATASYADRCTWTVRDKNGQLWTLEQLAMTYPNFNFHDTLGKLVMNNVPKELDGAVFFCAFEGAGGRVESNGATLKVNYEPEETPAPSPSPTPAPTSSPKPSPTPTPKPTAHIHNFSSDWKSDDGIHWHECDCGEQKDFAPHKFTWETVKKATRSAPGMEKGVCSVCGYEKDEELTYDGFSLKDFSLKDFSFSENEIKILAAAAAALLLIIIGLIIAAKIKRRKELERRRKEALRRRRQREYDEYQEEEYTEEYEE